MLFPQSHIVLDQLIMLDQLYGSRSMTSSAVGWLADCAREFNNYLSCQLLVKLTGTLSAPHARRLGSVLGAKQIFPALAYMERENPSGGILHQHVRVGGYMHAREKKMPNHGKYFRKSGFSVINKISTATLLPGGDTVRCRGKFFRWMVNLKV